MPKNINIINECTLTLDDVNKYSLNISTLLKNRDIVIMKGGLGYGKTTLTRSIAAALGCRCLVSSPSFTLVNEYDITLQGNLSTLRHIDLYRLNSVQELDDIGFWELLASDGISIVEWGDKFISHFDMSYYILEIEMPAENIRLYRLGLIV